MPVTQAVAPYGGHVAQLLGDGALVYFGYPTSRTSSTPAPRPRARRSTASASASSYNAERTHSGKYCYGKTPPQTFIESATLAARRSPLVEAFGAPGKGCEELSIAV